jgi:hypothetical protein
MASDARRIVESVLGGYMTARVWTAIYSPVFPFSPASFSVGALLPMVLYLFRWGHRRGRGKFKTTFSVSGGKQTITSVSNKLAENSYFSGFEGEVGQVVLGDLLLTSVLENRRHAEGHSEQIQRCFSSHYMASWIDLPAEAGHLRGVPEMLVAMIADQVHGDILEAETRSGRYPVGARVQDNQFVAAFATGILDGEMRSDVRSDRFNESAQIGLDQLLTVRLAQLCGEAPGKAMGKGEPASIPNQRPIAAAAGAHFREDLLAFFDCYGRNGAVPRLSLLPMLEVAIAIGLSTIVLSTIDIIERWSATGSVPDVGAQRPWPLFMDCSGAADPALRDFSEQSSMLARQQLARSSAALMYMRLLDYYATNEADIPRKDLPDRAPDGATWINLLGSIATGVHEESRDAEKFFRSKCRALVGSAEQEQSTELRADILSNEDDGRKHGVRLAEALALAWEEAGKDQLNGFLHSALMTNEPHGLARRRRVMMRKPGINGRKTMDATSLVLSNTALEYLVHRHLRRDGKGRKARDLSLPDFLTLLRERYGFYIDQSPPNMAVPHELLQRNRRVLERRLRDLGLLVGVNDAERMKKLKARYHTAYDAANAEATRP